MTHVDIGRYMEGQVGRRWCNKNVGRETHVESASDPRDVNEGEG